MTTIFFVAYFKCALKKCATIEPHTEKCRSCKLAHQQRYPDKYNTNRADIFAISIALYYIWTSKEIHIKNASGLKRYSFGVLSVVYQFLIKNSIVYDKKVNNRTTKFDNAVLYVLLNDQKYEKSFKRVYPLKKHPFRIKGPHAKGAPKAFARKDALQIRERH